MARRHVLVEELDARILEKIRAEKGFRNLAEVVHLLIVEYEALEDLSSDGDK